MINKVIYYGELICQKHSITCWKNVESPVSSGAKKAIKKIGQGVERGNKLYPRGPEFAH